MMLAYHSTHSPVVTSLGDTRIYPHCLTEKCYMKILNLGTPGGEKKQKDSFERKQLETLESLILRCIDYLHPRDFTKKRCGEGSLFPGTETMEFAVNLCLAPSWNISEHQS